MQDLRTSTRTPHAGVTGLLPRWQDTTSPLAFLAAEPQWQQATAASGRSFDALDEAYDASGGLACGDNLFATLTEHLPKQSEWLARGLASRHIFSFVWRSWTWVPMVQLSRHDLSWSNHMARVRSMFEPRASEWSVALWFATPNEQLANRRPVDTLQLDYAAVQGAARNDSKLI